MNRNILFVSAEYAPLLKVGGLADVAASLPRALARRDHDVRVLVPAFGCIRDVDITRLPVIARFRGIAPGSRFLLREYRDEREADPHAPVVWLLDAPMYRRREVSPYEPAPGADWEEECRVFGEFCFAAALLASPASPLPWHPGIVHANEWHTGMVPVFQFLQKSPVPCLFTIHNMAYQGRFPAASIDSLQLPHWLLHPDALEFHGGLSFLKAGIRFADTLTTVSRCYAEEILTPTFGEGLEGLLRERRKDLHGIPNGIDTISWNPAKDDALSTKFSARNPAGKNTMRDALVQALHLSPCEQGEAVVAFVGRLSAQKGIDLLLGALPRLMELPIRLVVLGTGDPLMQHALREAALKYPGRFALRLRYDEALAHRVFGGSDILLMPSHFEPCGLTQLYAMRYGCIPVAHDVGGLRDTIVDTDGNTLESRHATGFLFRAATVERMLDRLGDALDVFSRQEDWKKLVRSAMTRDSSWSRAARKYESLYRMLLRRHRKAG